MENCTECKLALDKAWQVIMSEGIIATDYKPLDDIAVELAYANRWTCASKGKECEDGGGE